MISCTFISPSAQTDLHSDPNITEVEEEEEGGTAEKHIANTARQVSQDLHKYVVDKEEANWSTLHHPVHVQVYRTWKNHRMSTECS